MAPMRSLMLRRPWPVRRVSGASGAVVAEVEGEPVGVVQGEGDVGVGAGVFDGVLQPLRLRRRDRPNIESRRRRLLAG
jgi:hypothetical protein